MWMDSEPEKLSARAQELCRSPENTLMISVVSLWEMQIKIQLGKLKLKMPLAELIREQRENGVGVLPVEAAHIFALASLPDHHKDPFDRLLVAQAITEGMVLVSSDPMIAQYPENVVW